MVYMFLADGFEETEALCPLDLMRRAKIDVVTVGVTGKIVTGSHNIQVCADISIDEADCSAPLEMVICPGGMPGAANIDNSKKAEKIILKAYKDGAYLAAICAAPMIFGKRGLLNGKKAVCYPGFEKYLEGADVQNKGVVADGKIITARAMGSAVDFGLELIRALRGSNVADEIKSAVIYE